MYRLDSSLLFVAILVVLSVQDLRPNSQDASAFYLENIYQIFADPSLPRPSIPSVAQPPAFSPPGYALWVNSLWFFSLVTNLLCATMATLLRSWARRYLRVTQMARCSPDKQARVRAFIANGVDKYHVAMAVEALAALVHFSLFTFFVGLLNYLFNISHTVFSTVVCPIALSSAIYVCITLMPVVRHDSPYHTPYSAISWLICTSGLFSVFRVLVAFRRQFGHEKRERFLFLMLQYRGWLVGGIRKAIEETASKWSSESDVRVLESTLGALRDDDALEKFIEALPGFYQSDMIKDLQQRLPEEVRLKILRTLVGFSRRTLSSNEISVSVKIRRLAICFEAAGQVQTSSGIQFILDNMIHVNWRRIPHSVEIGHFLGSWDRGNDGQFASYIQIIVGGIIASTRDQNDRWIALAMEHLGVSEHVLRDYLVHGDSVLLANLIHITRQLSRSDSSDRELIGALQSLSEFDIHNALPGLQHDFCALWNEISQGAQNNEELGGPKHILTNIRPVYIALHPNDGPLSHPLCHDPRHYPGSTPQANEAFMEAAQPPATSITGPHRGSVLVSLTPSLPASHPDNTIPSTADTGDLRSPLITVSHSEAQISQPHPISPFDSASSTPMSHR